MVNSKDFALRLQKILDFYAITATAFSDLIEVNRSTISHLLSGRNKPSLEFVLKVLEAFPEVELYWLLNGQGHFPTPKSQAATKVAAEPFDGVSELSPSVDQDDQKAVSSLEPQQSGLEESNEAEVERIVIFFKNGLFKTYRP